MAQSRAVAHLVLVCGLCTGALTGALNIAAAAPMTPEEIAQMDARPAGQAKLNGKLVLGQLQARAVAASDGADGRTPNYYVYRGMQVGLNIFPGAVALRATEGFGKEQLAAELAKVGVVVTGIEDTGAEFVIFRSADDLKSIERVAQVVEALTRSAAVAFAAPVFIAPLRSDSWCIPSERVVVRADQVNLPSGADAAKLAGEPMRVVQAEFGTFGGGSILAVNSKSGFAALRAANALSQLGDFGVMYAEPDMLTLNWQAVVPNDTEFNNQWIHRNTGQYVNWTAGMDMHSVAAWDLATGSGVKVAVVDCGVEAAHPDINQLPGRDFTTGVAAGIGDGSAQFQCERHGTPCAGIVSSTWNNNLDTAGVAPNSNTLSIRFGVQNQGTACTGSFSANYSNLVNGLVWALGQGVRVSTNSFSLGGTLQALEDQYVACQTAGLLSFCSTGNDTASTIAYPASANGTVAIGAIDPNGVKSSFSNTGTGIDLVAGGTSVRTADRVGAFGYDSGNLTWFSGTSAAAPVAGGVAAVITSYVPSATSAQILNAMTSTARDLGPAGYDTSYGYGMPQMLEALQVFAPTNDVCGSAFVISSFPYTGTQNTAAATITAGETLATCVSSSGHSVWHVFSTPDGYYDITADTFGSDFDTVLSAHNACSGGTTLACNDDSGGLQSTITFRSNLGTTTYLRTASFGTRVGGNLALHVNRVLVAPPNDLKANAIALNPAGQTIRGTTNGATNDFPGGSTCGVSAASPDVWYTVTLPTSDCNALYTVSTVNAATNYDTVLSVYSGPIDSLTEIACNDDFSGLRSQTTFSAVAGRTYFVRVSGYNGGVGVFDLTLSRGGNVGDECATAVPLVVGATPYHSSCFTNTTGLANTCGAGTIFKDGWYTLGFPVESNVTIDLQGSTFDSVVAVYPAGACPTATTLPLVCNDDYYGLQSRVDFVAAANAVYFVRVGVYSGSYTGDGNINVSATPTAPPCLADVNSDGTVDGGDFVAFINSFAIGDVAIDPTADVNHDGTIDGNDFVAFINAFAVGC